jgi:5-keto 4-deoxyuronate isomerase
LNCGCSLGNGIVVWLMAGELVRYEDVDSVAPIARA